MSFSISARNLSHIKRKVESGKYASADEVLVTALSLLDERDDTLDRELPDMRERVRKGTQQADAGSLFRLAKYSKSCGTAKPRPPSRIREPLLLRAYRSQALISLFG